MNGRRLLNSTIPAVRIELSLRGRLISAAKKTGKTESEAIREAIENWVNKNTN